MDAAECTCTFQGSREVQTTWRGGGRHGGREGTGTHILYVRYIILLHKRKAGRERGTKNNNNNKNPTEDGKRRHTHKKSQEAGGQTEKGATSCDHQRDRQPASRGGPAGPGITNPVLRSLAQCVQSVCPSSREVQQQSQMLPHLALVSVRATVHAIR